MPSHRKIPVETPRTGGGTIAGFLAVLVCSFGALAVQATQSQTQTQMARTVLVDRQLSLSAGASSERQETIEEPALAAEAGERVASASQPATAALCDIDVCSGAYRSFRASDCTFQPYDGPRKLCTR